MVAMLTLANCPESKLPDMEVPSQRLKLLGCNSPVYVDPNGILVGTDSAARGIVLLSGDASQRTVVKLPKGTWTVNDLDMYHALVSSGGQLSRIDFDTATATPIVTIKGEVTNAILVGGERVAVFDGKEIALYFDDGKKWRRCGAISGKFSSVEPALNGFVLVGMPQERSGAPILVYGVYENEIVLIGMTAPTGAASLYATSLSDRSYGKVVVCDYEDADTSLELVGVWDAYDSRGERGAPAKGRQAKRDATSKKHKTARAGKAGIGAHLAALIGHVRATKRRRKPLGASAVFLADKLAADVEAMIRARSEHQYGTIAIGDLRLDDRDFALQVPDAYDMVRDDVIPIGQTGGGDVFVIPRKAGERSVWRVFHDDGWSSEQVADSIDELLCQYAVEAADKGQAVDVKFG